MNDMYQSRPRTIEITTTVTMTRVYQWMMIGVLLTAIVAYYVSSDMNLMRSLLGGPMKWVLLIGQLGLVFAISGLINRISSMTATILFLLYSALTGATLSVLVLAYTAQSIQLAFLTTSLSFGALAIFGYVTKKDLSGMATFLFMALIGVVIYSVLGMFFNSMMSGTMGVVINVITLLIFAGFTAYDSQRIKHLLQQNFDEETRNKIAITSALSMYLNFINMFIQILSLTGNRRD